jgi:hypothetical protein
MGRLDALPVDPHMPAAYGSRRRATAFEEPRAPQPPIDAEAIVVALVSRRHRKSQKQYA